MESIRESIKVKTEGSEVDSKLVSRFLKKPIYIPPEVFERIFKHIIIHSNFSIMLLLHYSCCARNNLVQWFFDVLLKRHSISPSVQKTIWENQGNQLVAKFGGGRGKQELIAVKIMLEENTDTGNLRQMKEAYPSIRNRIKSIPHTTHKIWLGRIGYKDEHSFRDVDCKLANFRHSIDSSERNYRCELIRSFFIKSSIEPLENMNAVKGFTKKKMPKQKEDQWRKYEPDFINWIMYGFKASLIRIIVELIGIKRFFDLEMFLCRLFNIDKLDEAQHILVEKDYNESDWINFHLKEDRMKLNEVEIGEVDLLLRPEIVSNMLNLSLEPPITQDLLITAIHEKFNLIINRQKLLAEEFRKNRIQVSTPKNRKIKDMVNRYLAIEEGTIEDVVSHVVTPSSLKRKAKANRDEEDEGEAQEMLFRTPKRKAVKKNPFLTPNEIPASTSTNLAAGRNRVVRKLDYREASEESEDEI